MNKPVILGLTLVGVGGSVIGFGAGYFVAKTRMEALMELQLQEEIKSVKDAFNRGQKAGEYATPESAARALIDPEEQGRILAAKIGDDARVEFEEKYVTPYTSTDGESDGEAIVLESGTIIAGNVNVFEHAPILVAGYPNPSDENAPYYISVDQFHEEHDDYDKNSITYYAGDMALADETESLIVDIPNTVCPDFAQNFGYNSGDEHIVYVRNDRLGIDFEISRDLDFYSVKVLGEVPEPAETFQKTRKTRSRARDDRDD